MTSGKNLKTITSSELGTGTSSRTMTLVKRITAPGSVRKTRGGILTSLLVFLTATLSKSRVFDLKTQFRGSMKGSHHEEFRKIFFALEDQDGRKEEPATVQDPF